MTPAKIELLQEELCGLQQAAQHLAYSLQRCQNLIAHEYATDKMQEIFATVAALAPILLSIIPVVDGYAQSTIRRYGLLGSGGDHAATQAHLTVVQHG